VPNQPIPTQIKQEITLGTRNDDTKDWLTRVIESAETQYKTLGVGGHVGKKS